MSKNILKEENIVAHEYEWPAHVVQVTTEGWGVLTMTELRVILAMLGTDPESQPKLKSALIERIEDLITDDSVRGQAIYECVCKHKLPTGTKPIPSGGKWTSTDFMAEATKLLAMVKKDLSAEAVEQFVVSNMAQAQQEIRKHIDASLASARVIEIKLPGDKKSTKPDGLTHDVFEEVLMLASQALPVLLVGPTQCGKTTLCRQVATSLKLPFYAQSMSGGMTESKLLGRVLPRKNGAAEFVGTPFLEAYENGGVFLADEVDASDANVLTALNMAIANGELWLADRDAKPMAKMHKNFRLIAAANTFGFGSDSRYVGRNALDYATLERFGCGVVYMDYSARVETSLARKQILDWCWSMRARIRASQLEREMSTRTIVVLEKMTEAYGWDVKKWEERFFANWSAEEKRLLKLDAPTKAGWGSATITSNDEDR